MNKTSTFATLGGMSWPDQTADTFALQETTTAAIPLPVRPAPPEFLVTTMFVCDRVLLPLVCSLGILGNGLSLCVLTRREMAAATTCFLTALAASDLMLLGLQLPVFLEHISTLAHQDGFKLFIRYYTIVRYMLTNVFITCTCWLTVAVTTERFLSLRFMFNPRLVCTVHRARIASLAIFLVSFVFHFSKFFEYEPNLDLSSPRPILTTYLVHTPAYETYVHITNIALAAIIPVFLLVVANAFLVYFLATHRRRMLRHRRGSSNGNTPTPSPSSQGPNSGGGGGGNMSSVDMMHVSAIVVATVLVFLACHSVGVYLALTIASRGRRWVFAHPTYIAMKHVNTVLVMVNSSVNFLLYCAISRKFRKVFARVLRRRLSHWKLVGSQSGVASRREPWTTAMPLSEGGSAANTLGRSRGFTSGDSSSFRQHYQQHRHPPSMSAGSKIYTSSSKSATSNGSYSNGVIIKADV